MSNTISCPRCNSPDCELMTQSRTADWRVHLCRTCFYGWRSSEPAAFTRYDLYDRRFRLTPELIARFSNFPPIPARKNPAAAPASTNESRPIRRGGMDG
jgi:hypothetical protein